MSSISLRQLAKRYPDGTEALAPTDLSIADGELFVLVGPSGCGKSTLLKLIVGLERPSGGSVWVGDADVTRRDPKDRNMAMVFQSYAIYPHMTVRENLAFPLKLARLPRAEIDARVERAAGLLELDALLARKPAALSGGQRQRVAMGRAIVREPAAFLLDEPLSNLDAKLRVQMRNELSRLQRRLGTTMVYVTHDQTEAMTLGQRIAVLRGGRIQQVGTPRQLYQAPANLFVAGFIGAPAMNLLPARVDGRRLRLPMTDLPLPAHLADALPTGDGAVIAGIRPERIRPERIRPDRIHAADGAASQVPGSGVFRTQVRLVEWLGADAFVHFELTPGQLEAHGELRRTPEVDFGSGSLGLVARLGGECAAREGDELTLAIDPSDLLLFDPESGRRIGAD